VNSWVKIVATVAGIALFFWLISGSSESTPTSLQAAQQFIDSTYIQSLAISQDGKRLAVPSGNDVRVFELTK
jgi:hypothetical protein